MDSEKKVFDPKTLLVVAVVGVVFFGWQKYLEIKYPDYYSAKKIEKQGPSASLNQDQKLNNTEEQLSLSEGQTASPSLDEVKSNYIEKTFPLTTRLWSGQISSRGMGLVETQDLSYKDYEGNPILFSSGLPLLQVVDLATGLPVVFEISITEPNSYVGRGVTQDGSTIKRTIQVLHDTGSLNIFTEIEKASSEFKGFGVRSSERLKENKSSSFLMPNLDYQEVVVRSQGSVDHLKFAEDLAQESSLVDLFALSSQYFTVGYLDKSSILASATLASEGGVTSVLIKYLIPAAVDNLRFESLVFIGPKSLDMLEKVDDSLADIINLGFFSSIGNVLLRLLKFLNQFANNWGLAIILLTLVVRLVVLPFNVMSYKSMKKMQKIQPKLKKVREQYKDDPSALNRETMNLMKTEKVNPLGGCLPMFLQMPVFFALYQVLGQSVELYQAPFIFWIQDLSLKDPFYVLPILMGVTLFLQHKITPTTMDPQQAKIMAWMPVIFSAFTLGLPSGLTLYIFISTLFGVIQQQIFMMDKKQEVLS